MNRELRIEFSGESTNEQGKFKQGMKQGNCNTYILIKDE